MADYPNLEAILDGRTSGHVTEWPLIRTELRALFDKFAAAEAEKDSFASLVTQYASEKAPDAIAKVARDRDEWAKRAETAERERDELIHDIKRSQDSLNKEVAARIEAEHERDAAMKDTERLQGALLLFTNFSMSSSRPDRGESSIGWQRDDGPTARERVEIARAAIAAKTQRETTLTKATRLVKEPAKTMERLHCNFCGEDDCACCTSDEICKRCGQKDYEITNYYA